MQHKVKVTVIDKKLYTDLQQQYCADPESGKCPCYHVGDVFVFERYGTADDFWHIGRNTLKQTACTAGNIAGGPGQTGRTEKDQTGPGTDRRCDGNCFPGGICGSIPAEGCGRQYLKKCSRRMWIMQDPSN